MRKNPLFFANMLTLALGASISFANGHWVAPAAFGLIALTFRYSEFVPLLSLSGTSELSAQLSAENNKESFTSVLLLRLAFAIVISFAVWIVANKTIDLGFRDEFSYAQLTLIAVASIFTAQTSQWLVGQKNFNNLAVQRIGSRLIGVISLWSLYVIRNEPYFVRFYIFLQSVLLILFSLYLLKPRFPGKLSAKNLTHSFKLTISRLPDLLGGLEVVIVAALVPADQLVIVYLPQTFGQIISLVLDPSWQAIYRCYISNSTDLAVIKRLKHRFDIKVRKQCKLLAFAVALAVPLACLILFRRQYYWLIFSSVAFTLTYLVAQIGIPARYALICTKQLRYQFVHSVTTQSIRLLFVAGGIHFFGPAFAWLGQFVAYLYSVILAEVYWRSFANQTTSTNGSPTK